jgi:hypothetical protein
MRATAIPSVLAILLTFAVRLEGCDPSEPPPGRAWFPHACCADRAGSMRRAISVMIREFIVSNCVLW